MTELVQEGLAQVTLSVDYGSGMTAVGVWDTFEGGGIRAPSRTYRPGGSQAAVLTVGFSTVEDITLTRGYRVSRDPLVERDLMKAIGQPCTVTKVMLDASKSTLPDTQRVFSGRLLSVSTPRARSDGGDEVAMLAVTIGVEGDPA